MKNLFKKNSDETNEKLDKLLSLMESFVDGMSKKEENENEEEVKNEIETTEDEKKSEEVEIKNESEEVETLESFLSSKGLSEEDIIHAKSLIITEDNSCDEEVKNEEKEEEEKKVENEKIEESTKTNSIKSLQKKDISEGIEMKSSFTPRRDRILETNKKYYC